LEKEQHELKEHTLNLESTNQGLTEKLKEAEVIKTNRPIAKPTKKLLDF